MKKTLIIGIFVAHLLLPVVAVKAQPLIADSADQNFFLRKESITQIYLHTAGIGFGYGQGKHITVNKKNIWEVEWLNQLSPKEIRSVSPWAGNTKSYVYGKENYFFAIRGGIGRDILLNRKPYWGGIEVRYFYRGGLALGFVKPVYLEIINYTPGFQDYYLTTERYDYYRHFYDNIYGRAPFLKGFDALQLRPGIYGKFGFNFDFGSENDRIKCLEVGGMFDYYPNTVPFTNGEVHFYSEGISIMAENPTVDGFYGFYLGFKWGKRYNKNNSSENNIEE